MSMPIILSEYKYFENLELFGQNGLIFGKLVLILKANNGVILGKINMSIQKTLFQYKVSIKQVWDKLINLLSFFKYSP